MIMTIVDSGGKLPKGAAAAVFAMLAYVAAASIVAGLGDLGAGLLVLVMGGVTVGIVDYVMWRDVARETGGGGEAVPSRLGSYVLAGPEGHRSPEMPAVITAFDPVRREDEPAPPAGVVASAPPSAPADYLPADPSPAAPVPANPVPANPAVAEPAPLTPAPAPEIVVAPETAPAPATATAEAQADTVGTRPATLDGPRGAPDDLKRINGIGPANERKLNALGIYHFDQIAEWDEAQVRWVGTYLAFPGRIEREGWVAQARAFASVKATA
ncbi:MAG: hypothetical protein ACFE0R_08340 [Salinarimonas sp.]